MVNLILVYLFCGFAAAIVVLVISLALYVCWLILRALIMIPSPIDRRD